MALDKTALKNTLQALLTDMRSKTEVSDEEFATRLADAIDTYVKEADIIYTTGLTASGAPVTGTFNGQLE